MQHRYFNDFLSTEHQPDVENAHQYLSDSANIEEMSDNEEVENLTSEKTSYGYITPWQID